jgi:hypothetical protein
MLTELADFPSESPAPPLPNDETVFVPCRKSAGGVTFEFVRVKVLLPEWPEQRTPGRQFTDSEEYWTGSRRPVWVSRAVSMLDALAVRISELTERCLERARAYNVSSREVAWLLGTCGAFAAAWFITGWLINVNYPVTALDARPVVLRMPDVARTVPPPDAKFSDVAPQRPITSPRRRSARAPGPFIGTLSVRSVPSGASVWVDQKPVGSTPLVGLQMRAGSHAIWIEHVGFPRWSAAVHVPANRRTEVAATLDAPLGRPSR